MGANGIPVPPGKVTPRRNETKRLNWNLIPPAKVAATMFADENVQKIAKLDEDIHRELLEQFSSKPLPRSIDTEDQGTKDSPSNDTKMAGILEQKKVTNILIMLRKFEVSPKDIATAVETLDPFREKLTDDNVAALSVNQFKDEELVLAKNYTASDEEISRINEAEALAYYVARVPRFSAKVKAMWTIRTFDSIGEEIGESIRIVTATSREIRTSAQFQSIVAFVLGIGNYLNAGTAKGQAHGFRLETLLRLTDTKSQAGDTNLLHYVVRAMMNRGYKISKLTQEIPSVTIAKRISKEDIVKEISTLERAVQLLQAEISAMILEGDEPSDLMTERSTPPPPSFIRRSLRSPKAETVVQDDNLEKVEDSKSLSKDDPPPDAKPVAALRAVQDTFKRASDSLVELQKLQNDMLREFADTVVYLGEESKTAKTEEIFDTVWRFITSFEACVKETEEINLELERKERLAKLKEEDDKRRELSTQKPKVGENEDMPNDCDPSVSPGSQADESGSSVMSRHSEEASDEEREDETPATVVAAEVTASESSDKFRDPVLGIPAENVT